MTIQILCRTVLFGGLTSEAVTKVAECATPIVHGEGEVLYLSGDEPKGIYVLSSGCVRSVRNTKDGKEQVLSVDFPYSTLCEVPVFDRGRCFVSAITQEQSELLFLSRDDIHRVCGESAELLANIVEVLARRVRSYADLIHTLALRDVDRRVAWFLLQEAINRGVRTSDGTAIELLVTHHDIAARVGSVREMVTRAFGHLQKAGLIVANGRLVMIPRETELMNYVGS